VTSGETGPLVEAPSSGSWWDVPDSATSTLGSTRQARVTDEEPKARQRLFLTRPTSPDPTARTSTAEGAPPPCLAS